MIVAAVVIVTAAVTAVAAFVVIKDHATTLPGNIVSQCFSMHFHLTHPIQSKSKTDYCELHLAHLAIATCLPLSSLR